MSSEERVQPARKCIQQSHSHHSTQDGSWAWLVLFIAWFSNLVVGGIGLSFPVVLPALRDYFGKTRQQTGEYFVNYQGEKL